MIVGASFGSFGGLTFKDAVAYYSSLSLDFNLKAVELRFEKEIHRPSLWSWELNDDILDFLAQYECTGAHLPFVYLNSISPNPQIKKVSLNLIKNAIKRASELEMNYTVLHAKGFAYGLTNEQQMMVWIKVIKELAAFAEEHSILLTVENADFLTNLSDLALVVETIDSNWLKITFDIGHAYIRKVRQLSSYPIIDLGLRFMDIFFPFISNINMPYEKFGSIREFIKRKEKLITVVHIHDYNGRQDHLKIGEGKIDFSFLRELKENPKRIYIFESNSINYRHKFSDNYLLFKKFMNDRH